MGLARQIFSLTSSNSRLSSRKAGKCLDFALRFAQFGGRSEGLADRFSIFFARQPEVGAVAGLVWLMTTALRFTTAATDSSDGTAAKITQIDNTRQNGTALVFEGNPETLTSAPPILTCYYVRKTTTKKEPPILSLSCRIPHEMLADHWAGQEAYTTKGRRKNNFTDSVRSCSSTSAECRAASAEGIEAVRMWVQYRWGSCDGRVEQ